MRVLKREATTEPAPVARFKRQFDLPDRPSASIPDLPHDMDDLSDSDLMEAYREFVAWVSFAKAELVKAEIAEEYEAHTLRVTEAHCLIQQWDTESKSDRVTLAKARRDVDPQVVSQQEALLAARAYRKLSEALFDRCERGAQLLSRELTRRVGGGQRDVRNARMSA